MEIEGWSQTLGAAPLLAIAAGAIALILVLVIRFKLHAFLTSTSGAWSSPPTTSDATPTAPR